MPENARAPEHDKQIERGNAHAPDEPTAGPPSERDMLHALVENAPAHLAYLDPQFNYLTVNVPYARGRGSSPAALVGRNHFDLFPDSRAQAVFEHVRDTGQTAEFRVQPGEIASEAGHAVTYWNWTLTPIKDGQGRVEGLVLSLTEVTPAATAAAAVEALMAEAQDSAGALETAHSQLWEQAIKLRTQTEELRVSGEELGEAQQALEQERRRYQDLFEFAPDGYLVTDLAGVIHEANRAAGALLGVSPEYLLGMPLSLYAADKPAFSGLVTRLKAQPAQIATMTLQFTPSKRDPFPARVRVAVALGAGGRPAGLRWLVQDISDIKQAELQREAALEALRQARDELERRVEERTAELKRANEALTAGEERFRQLAENSTEVFWISDRRTGRLLYVSPAFEAVWGSSREGLARWGDLLLRTVHPGDRERVLTAVERLFDDGQSYEDRYRIVRPDGAVRWLHVRAFPVRSPLGQVYRLAGLVADVTERVAAYELLEQRVSRRTRELSTLLEISRHVALSMDLASLLRLIVDQLEQAVGYDSATIYCLDGEELLVRAYRGPRPEQEMLGARLALADMPIRREVLRDPHHTVLRRAQPAGEGIPALHSNAGESLMALEPEAQCWIGLPLSVQDRVVGLLELYYHRPDGCSLYQMELAAAFASQAAVAIETARLYEQARELAVIEERQRLARDLHDAVSQTLFSANLIAEVLPRLWERDPELGRQSLAQLHELNQGALAEMRSLLMELRPRELVEANLDELLRLLANVVTGRSRIPVSLEVEAPCRLPPDVQLNVYRLAQEALHNVAKHSGASQAVVRLHCHGLDPGGGQPSGIGRTGLELRISDDGKGFDPENIAANSMGLDIMRERAAEIGASLAIDSHPGAGTEVTVIWPAG